MGLGRSSHVVVGATDPAATVDAFRTFGFAPVPAAAAAVPVGPGEVVVQREGRTPTPIVIVPTDRPGIERKAYDLGPRGLDLYTSDMDESLEVVGVAGLDAGPVGTVEIGPMRMRQVTVAGPDDLPIVLIENTHRRSSRLDDHPDELHSELHSVVWAVPDLAVDATWFEARGATRGMDLAFAEHGVSTFMGLPDPVVELRMVMLSDAEVAPIRFELLEFADQAGTPAPVDPDAVAGGLHAVGYLAPDGAPATLVSPGGVVLDLR